MLISYTGLICSLVELCGIYRLYETGPRRGLRALQALPLQRAT